VICSLIYSWTFLRIPFSSSREYSSGTLLETSASFQHYLRLIMHRRTKGSSRSHCTVVAKLSTLQLRMTMPFVAGSRTSVYSYYSRQDLLCNEYGRRRVCQVCYTDLPVISTELLYCCVSYQEQVAMPGSRLSMSIYGRTGEKRRKPQRSSAGVHSGSVREN
jgi:hypothetical protein